MPFKLLPILDILIDLYKKPRTPDRFQAYLKTLQGDTKSDLAVPISGFNPMAKAHLLDRLHELKELGAEEIIKHTLIELNTATSSKCLNRIITIAINVSDDLQGGWTNRYTSDYDSKFRFNGLFSRNFCVPIFWSSEKCTAPLIRQRTLEYAFRTLYWMDYPKPKTLQDHLKQEVFVAHQTKTESRFSEAAFSQLANFYKANEHATDYSLIFNFFYGDKASASLGFLTYGLPDDITGFEYAIEQAQKRR